MVMQRRTPQALPATRPLAVAAALVVAGAGCGEAPAGGAWRAAVDTAGGVTTVRTLAGRVWRDTARLVEEASIGAVAGEEAYLLGHVVGLAADGRRIYVLDDQVPVVRVYDWEGRHLRDIGGEGEGPGEFRNPAGVAVGPDGLVYVHDGGQGRITVFTAGGALVETRRTPSFNTYVPALTVSPDGLPCAPRLTNPEAPVHRWRSAMVCYGPDGPVGDTLGPPAFDYEPPRLPARGRRGVSFNVVPFAPRLVWSMSPSGAVLAGVPDDYRFQVRRGGRTTVVEKASWEPVPVRDDEAAWHRRFIVVMNRAVEPGWSWNGPPIPGHKPAYHRLVGDRDGRVWVARPGPGERLEGGTEDSDDPADFFFNPLWRDRLLLDVFEEGGRYLGPVEAPTGMRFALPRPWILHDVVVAVVEDERGVQYVKRYRLVARR